ncbi:MAG: hypothetical protein WAN35_21785 [Terracidiphilus sp.]
MEADWEFELGANAPVMDAAWAGLVDLRRWPELAWHLPEAEQLPALAEALVRLNSADSPVWSAKCDYWPVLAAGEFDPDELDAPPECAEHATGCYIDLLAASEGQWLNPEVMEKACKRWCGLLHSVTLRGCRVDLVIRRAILAPEQTELGITAYLTACGASRTEAARRLQDALAVFADALRGHSTIE